MDSLVRSLKRVAAFFAGLLPGPPSSESPPPDIDAVRDADADARRTALEIEMLQKDGRGSGR